MLGQVLVKVKKNIQLFIENMAKELFVSIMKKFITEMEKITGKLFELIWDNDPILASNLAKEFYKNNCKWIDWPAYGPDLSPVENIWTKWIQGWIKYAHQRFLKLYQKWKRYGKN